MQLILFNSVIFCANSFHHYDPRLYEGKVNISRTCTEMAMLSYGTFFCDFKFLLDRVNSFLYTDVCSGRVVCLFFKMGKLEYKVVFDLNGLSTT